MAIKTKEELQSELPVLIKTKNLVSSTKTTGDSLREMLLDIIDSMGYLGEGVPEGAICEWYSTVDTIPQYWVLCDGRFDSPDLRDKFVIGAGGTYPINATGGSAIHNHEGTVGGHALQLNEIPGHTHGYRAYVQSGSNSGSGGEAAGYFEDKQTDSAGGGAGGAAVPHTHPLNLSSVSTLPPYHSLVYMMFKGVDFTGDTEVPSIVLNLVVSENTLSSFKVSWTASTDNVGVIGYDVYVNGVYRDTTSSLSMLINGLDPSTSYTINVKARDAGGNTSVDSTTTGTTLGMPAASTSYYKSSYATGNGNTNDYVIYKNSSNANVVKNFTRTSNNNTNPCESITHYGIVEVGAGADPCTPSSTTNVLSLLSNFGTEYYSSGYISITSIWYEYVGLGFIEINYLQSIINDRHFQVADAGTYKIRTSGSVRPSGSGGYKVIDIWLGKNQQAITEANNAVGLQKFASNLGGANQLYPYDNEITLTLAAGDTICVFARLTSGQGLAYVKNGYGGGEYRLYIDKIN